MEEKKNGKLFLLFVQIVLGGTLAFFTIVWSMDYSKNLIVGYNISGLVLLCYFFVLKKSLDLFNRKSVGAAYFLTFSGFIVLAFVEMVSCSNSLNWMH